MRRLLSAAVSNGARALCATLLARALLHGTFAFWLLSRDPSWFEVFWIGSAYGLGDGALGLLTGLLLARRKPLGAPPALVAMVLADAVLRLAAGIAIRTFPGIPDLPISIVLFFAALGAWATIGGAAAIGAWFVTHMLHHPRAGGPRPGIHALFDPLSVAGFVALAMASYAFVMGPPATAGDLRTAASVASGTLALVFLFALLGGARVYGIRRAMHQEAMGPKTAR